jgi:hypothetical protein
VRSSTISVTWSGSRDQRVVAVPASAHIAAKAVPQDPAPMTAAVVIVLLPSRTHPPRAATLVGRS